MRTRIMYIENKSAGLTGPCRIGRMRYSKTGSTLYYGDRGFKSLKGSGFKANFFDLVTGEEFWISGPRRDGADGLYGRITEPQDVDADVADAYWSDIRGLKAPPETRGRAGDDLSPAARDRLPFNRRDTVEHPRLDDAEPAPSGSGRKAMRIARELNALGPATES